MARWLNAEVHETELMIRRVTGSTNVVGSAANPSRHPVMANVFEQPSSRIVRSSIPVESSRCSRVVPLVVDRPVDLVGEHERSCSSASAARASRSSRASVLPQGLCGEFRIRSFVRSRDQRGDFGGVHPEAVASRSGTGTGAAPTKSVIDSYIGKPGSGYRTSSPSSQSAEIVKNMMGFAPGVMISGRRRRTRAGRCEPKYLATASRCLGHSPAGT